MKKAIIVSNYDSIANPYYSGGGAVAVHEVCKRLCKKHQVKFLAGAYRGNQDKKIDGVSYCFVGSSILGSKLGHLLYHIALVVRSKTEKYDLWIEGSSPPVTFSLLPLFSKNKVVSWVHMFAGADMHRKYKIPFQLLEKYLSRNYHFFIVLSEWAKNKIQKEYGNNKARVEIIPNGIASLPREKNRKTRTKNYFLFLGRLEINQKGLDLLISAFKNFDRKLGVKLIIVGNGSRREVKTLKTMIEDNNLSEMVKIWGRAEGKEKERLLSECLALVLPSRFDTYPLVILEAFSYSKPVVLFDLPQLAWVPVDSTLKSKCYDVDSYAEALKKIVDDERARFVMGKNAREFIRTKTWNEIYKRFLKYVESL